MHCRKGARCRAINPLFTIIRRFLLRLQMHQAQPRFRPSANGRSNSWETECEAVKASSRKSCLRSTSLSSESFDINAVRHVNKELRGATFRGATFRD